MSPFKCMSTILKWALRLNQQTCHTYQGDRSKATRLWAWHFRKLLNQHVAKCAWERSQRQGEQRLKMEKHQVLVIPTGSLSPATADVRPLLWTLNYYFYYYFSCSSFFVNQSTFLLALLLLILFFMLYFFPLQPNECWVLQRGWDEARRKRRGERDRGRLGGWRIYKLYYEDSWITCQAPCWMLRIPLSHLELI